MLPGASLFVRRALLSRSGVAATPLAAGRGAMLSTSTAAMGTDGPKNVAILGTGLMGTGIVQVAAATGHNITMIGESEDLVNGGLNRIKKSLERVAKRKYKDDASAADAFINDTLANIKTSTDAVDVVSNGPDLLIEAVPEDLDLKRKIFAELDAAAPEHTIFASNTSSLRIGQIAEATNRKDRFGGVHFFNPVPVMKLVEIIRTNDTSDATFDQLMKFGQNVGKVTVKCGDTPGFIVNRLLVPYMLEAARMEARGDATKEDIDVAMKLGAGYPMGPFQLLDYVGLDTAQFIAEGWHRDYPDEPLFNPVESIGEKVAEGKLGVKSGEGFYDYKK